MDSLKVDRDKWDKTLRAIQRGKRIERQLSNLLLDIEGQLGDDPEHHYVLGEPANASQVEVLLIIRDRINSILA